MSSFKIPFNVPAVFTSFNTFKQDIQDAYKNKRSFESGKTTFLQDAIINGDFGDVGKTLILSTQSLRPFRMQDSE